MARRPLLLVSALVLAAAAFVAGPAAADDATCVTTDESIFDGTVVCVERNSATSGSIPVPYSVGSVCVAGVCTPPQSGTIYVPKANFNVVRAYGQICYTISRIRTCRAFDTASLWPAIGSGTL